MTRQLILPRGRTAWAISALVAIIFAGSSVAPFARLGAGSFHLGGADLGAAAVYLATWLPFVLAAAWMVASTAAATTTVALHAALVLICPAAHAATFLTLAAFYSGDTPDLYSILGGPAFAVLTLLGTLQYLVLVAVTFAVAAGRAADRDRAHAAELQVQITRVRIDALTAQLRPHFLFNALNSIAVLTTTDAPAAEAMVRRLSDLLRSALSANDQTTVPLSAELQLLDAYVSIQRLRFGDRLRVEFDIAAGARQCAVPTLILQPLVENAIEHAIARRDAGEIVVAARSDATRLVVTVTDNGTPIPGATGPDGLGIGHANTRARLAALYGAAHEFAVQLDATGCTVRVVLPATMVQDTA